MKIKQEIMDLLVEQSLKAIEAMFEAEVLPVELSVRQQARFRNGLLKIVGRSLPPILDTWSNVDLVRYKHYLEVQMGIWDITKKLIPTLSQLQIEGMALGADIMEDQS